VVSISMASKSRIGLLFSSLALLIFTNLIAACGMVGDMRHQSSVENTFANRASTETRAQNCRKIEVVDVDSSGKVIATAPILSCSGAVAACGKAFLTTYAINSSNFFQCIRDGKEIVYQWDAPGYYFGKILNSKTISSTTGLWENEP